MAAVNHLLRLQFIRAFVCKGRREGAWCKDTLTPKERALANPLNMLYSTSIIKRFVNYDKFHSFSCFLF